MLGKKGLSHSDDNYMAAFGQSDYISDGLLGNVEGDSLVPKHRFSSMLSSSKNLTKAGVCSLPDDPSVDLTLDQSSSKFPVTEVISIPVTEFSCLGRLPGYYADNDSRISCKVRNNFIDKFVTFWLQIFILGNKVFHYCHGDDTIVSFICPTCTLFHEEKQLCDYWYNVECNTTTW